MPRINVTGGNPSGFTAPGTVVYPVVGGSDLNEEPKIPLNEAAIVNAINGNLGGANILPAFLQTFMLALTPAASGKSYQVAWGSHNFTGNVTPPGTTGSSPATEAVTIPHGMGATPSWYIAVPGLNGSGGSGWAGLIWQTSAPDGTNIYITCAGQSGGFLEGDNVIWQPFSNTVTYSVFWVAIASVTSPSS